MPEIDGLSKETVVTSWMSKYDFIMKGGWTFHHWVLSKVKGLLGNKEANMIF